MNKSAPAIFIALALLFFDSISIDAKELCLLGGMITNNADHDKSYSWEMLYTERLGSYADLSFAWLNEGHFSGHHRDGQTVQIWARKDALDHRLSFAAGVGPYLSFDTQEAEGSSYENAHGWGGVVSLSATYYMENRWLFKILANHVWEKKDLDTDSILIGIGYQLESFDLSPPASEEARFNDHLLKNEITVLHGRTILNSFESEAAEATEVECRRSIARYLEWTISWLYEGDVDISRRQGIASQIWPTRFFFDNRLALGVGIGAYAAVDDGDKEEAGGGGEAYLSGLLTMTAAYDISSRFLVRLSWNRTVTNYDRDTDIILAGLGYRF